MNCYAWPSKAVSRQPVESGFCCPIGVVVGRGDAAPCLRVDQAEAWRRVASGSSTTAGFRSKANTRWVWRGRTAGCWAKSRSRAFGGTAATYCETAALERQGAGTSPYGIGIPDRALARGNEPDTVLPLCHGAGPPCRACPPVAAAVAADRMAARSGGAGEWPDWRTAQLRSLHPTARSIAGPRPSAAIRSRPIGGRPAPLPFG